MNALGRWRSSSVFGIFEESLRDEVTLAASRAWLLQQMAARSPEDSR
ncbi:hypothetical protein ACIBF6_13480 [Streptosporangium amethystogenes]